MKLTYTTADGRISVELEGKTHKDLWRELARFQEVFEDIASGNIFDEQNKKKFVTSGDIKYRVRKSKYIDEKGKEKEAEYFEKQVVSGPLLGYKKMYGVLDDGTDGLFPKRAPEKDVIYGLNGWHKYSGPKGHENKNEEKSDEGKENSDPSTSVPF